MVKTVESKLRQQENRKKRIEIDKMIKNETYIDWLHNEHGVMNLDEIRTDKQFFKDMIRDIEKSRERSIVYNKQYQRSDLENWIRERDRKLMLRYIDEAAKRKREKEAELN